MDRTERIIRLHNLLRLARYPVPLRTLEDRLKCSRATVYRDLAFLRDALGAPLESRSIDDQAHFYYRSDERERFELPGLWLSAEELRALLILERLLPRRESEILDSALAPLRERITKLLTDQAGGKPLPLERIRIIEIGQRRVDPHSFRVVANAVLERRRLAFRYRARSTDEVTDREVSPQRLVHYRDNWYLDAYDHGREALRSFSLDRIRDARALPDRARDCDEGELDVHYRSSYGIFAGPAVARARIRFSAFAARWVAEERWHSQQEGRYLPGGGYELTVPFSNPYELLMDVLRYGAEAEILEPGWLREQARARLAAALAAYEREPPTE